ncbi:MAG: GTP-binding protein [Bacteroidales bacterium]|nr:GTP-binding protein [Bacteroidales bacterium]
MKIPLILVTGFLGSGKTSLLRQVLERLGPRKRIAIIQNEFAPGRVDSAELEASGIPFHLLEINNGSVFCACLLDDFIVRLAEFLKTYQPEAIFLEATGLADPVSLAQVMQAPEVSKYLFLGGVWTVIDSVNFNKYQQYVQRVRHQVQIADLILFNKSDLAAPDAAMTEQINLWNPTAEKFISRNGFFDNIEESISKSMGVHEIPDIAGLKESLPRPDIGSCVIRTQKVYTEKALIGFHDENKEIIYRLKGYVRSRDGQALLVHSVFGRLTIEKAAYWDGPTEIILMGPGIRPGLITKEFLKSGENA